MTLSGTDFIVPGPTSADDWWVLMFEVRQRWPDAIFHRTDPGEMFIYPDRDAFRDWFSSENPTGYLRVQMGPESLTLAVSEGATDGTRVGQEVVAVLQGLRGSSDGSGSELS